MAAEGAVDSQVVVVGAGPVGLMLAGELRLGGADVIVLERRLRPTTESRASTLHARTMEILDSRGLLEDLGTPPVDQRGHFGGIPLDLTLPSRHPGQWKVPQTRTEQLLEQWTRSRGGDIRRGWEVLELADRGDHVHVTARTPHGVRQLRARYLVGCDGEDSTVRRLTEAEFPGRSAVRELLRADVAGVDIPNRRFERLEHGLAIAARRSDGVTRVMVHEFGRAPLQRTGQPGFDEVIDVWKRVTGEDLSGGTPLWVNSFGDANRQLTRYRTGRVLFAGDAAHQQMPIGGQALNLGLQDAVNLGWKLALHLRADRSETLLDTYHTERHAVAARVLSNIRAQALLLLGDSEVEPVRSLLGELIADEDNRTRLAGMISGLDIRYDVGDGEDPLLGSRLPELTLATRRGPVTTTTLLRSGRGLLLDFAARPEAALGRIAEPWADRVTTVSAALTASDTPAPRQDALLVRPDGYIVWAGSEESEAGDALRRWFGSAESGR
ncbi:FAD-dependent monooxygenase [Streptomyces sp. NBC_00280]|uniref:FAD-dependent monooxygenase n=1 Tax=Streptomyces sp. NBC_00280 TaxID=2975699 RepID=UPI003251D569